MKTKKRPAKRRKKPAPTAFLVPTTTTASNTFQPEHIVWYPTLPPRETTWTTRLKDALASLWGLI